MIDSAFTILRWGIGLVLIFFTWYIISNGLKKYDSEIASSINQAEQDVSNDPLSTKAISTLTDGVTRSMKNMGGKKDDASFWDRFGNAIHRGVDEGTEFTRRFWDEKSETIRNVAQKIGEGFKNTIIPIIQPLIDMVYGIFVQPLVNTFWSSATNSGHNMTVPTMEEGPSYPEVPPASSTTPQSAPKKIEASKPPRRIIERDPSGLFN